jgi:two-component system, OmpR family, response regulator
MIKAIPDAEEIAAMARLTAVFAGRSALVMEDDPVLRSRLHACLSGAGFAEVVACTTGREAQALGLARRFDLLVFDRMNPDVDGADALSAIRNGAPATTSARAPALLVTALSADRHKISGLASGADDYVPKPVSDEELLARAAAQMRRAAWTEGQPARTGPLQNGPFLVDPSAHTALFRGVPVALTGKEFSMLAELSRHVGHPVTRLMLWDQCWPEWTYQPDQWTNTIDVALRRLRKSLAEVETALPEAFRPLVVNVRSEGFMIRDLSGLL